MEPIFRAARLADTPFLGDVLQMAGRGHLPRGPWDLCFPEPSERTRALQLLAGEAPRSWCHHWVFEIADVAVVEERRDAEFEALLGAPGFSRMLLAFGE